MYILSHISSGVLLTSSFGVKPSPSPSRSARARNYFSTG